MLSERLIFLEKDPGKRLARMIYAEVIEGKKSLSASWMLNRTGTETVLARRAGLLLSAQDGLSPGRDSVL